MMSSKGVDAEPKIIDFGLSIFFLDSTKLKDQFVGTLGYCAPEVLKRKDYDQKIDIWSLGVIFYKLLSGQSPFKGTSMEEIVAETLKKNINFDLPIWETKPLQVK